MTQYSSREPFSDPYPNVWARAKERDALVGDYPPMRLEVNGGSGAAE